MAQSHRGRERPSQNMPQRGLERNAEPGADIVLAIGGNGNVGRQHEGVVARCPHAFDHRLDAIILTREIGLNQRAPPCEAIRSSGVKDVALTMAGMRGRGPGQDKFPVSRSPDRRGPSARCRRSRIARAEQRCPGRAGGNVRQHARDQLALRKAGEIRMEGLAGFRRAGVVSHRSVAESVPPRGLLGMVARHRNRASRRDVVSAMRGAVTGGARSRAGASRRLDMRADFRWRLMSSGAATGAGTGFGTRSRSGRRSRPGSGSDAQARAKRLEGRMMFCGRL